MTPIGVGYTVVKRRVLCSPKFEDYFAFPVLIFQRLPLVQCPEFMGMCLREEERVKREQCCQGGPGLLQKGLWAAGRDPQCISDKHGGGGGFLSSRHHRFKPPDAPGVTPARSCSAFQGLFAKLRSEADYGTEAGRDGRCTWRCVQSRSWEVQVRVADPIHKHNEHPFSLNFR